MTEFHVDVTTPDGTMECFVAHPDGDGPFAPVILYMDVPGIREELRNFARRIAGQGYFCLLPDLYYRDGRVRFDLSKGEEELKKMFAIGKKLSVERVMRDTGGMLTYLRSNPNVTAKVGSIGYCMSGQFVVAAGGDYPEDFAAIASLYGTLIVTDKPDSPHLKAARSIGEFYLGFAETDPFVEDNVIRDVSAVFDENGIDYTVEVHPGTQHGFCFPERPQYVEAAAEKVWDTVFDLFDRRLNK